MKVPKIGWVLAGVLAVGLVAGAAVVAWMVTTERESEDMGTCGSAVYQLSVEPEDGALEVNFELSSAAPDETWMVLVQHNEAVLLEGERTTDEDAELDVDVPARPAGDNDFTVTATPSSGEACTARLRHG